MNKKDVWECVSCGTLNKTEPGSYACSLCPSTRHPAAGRAAAVLHRMAVAVDPGGKAQMTLVNWSHGATYNDGGTWYSSVWRMPGGVLKRAFIGSDYRMDDIEVERVVQHDFHGIEYEGRGKC